MGKLRKLDRKTKQELKRALLTTIPELFTKEAQSNEICLSASSLTSVMLNAYARKDSYWELQNEMKYVSIILTNPEALKIIQGNKDYSDIIDYARKGRIEYENFYGFIYHLREKYNIYTLGIIYDEKNLSELLWNGKFHIIIQFKDTSILDLTANQMTRENQNLRINRYWERLDNLPEPIIYFKPEKIRDNYGGALTLSPNYVTIANAISVIISNTLNTSCIIAQDERTKVYSEEKWKDFIKKNGSEKE